MLYCAHWAQPERKLALQLSPPAFPQCRGTTSSSTMDSMKSINGVCYCCSLPPPAPYFFFSVGQQRFREIDHDLVIDLARLARQAGVQRFVYVSAMGADASSCILYSRTKGEVRSRSPHSIW